MYRKNKNNIKMVLLAAGVAAASLRPGFIRADSTANTPAPLLTLSTAPADVLKSQIAAAQQQLTALNTQISGIQTQIQTKQSQTATLGNQMALYDLEIQATNIQEQATQTNIDNTNLQIQDSQNEIATKQQLVSQQKSVLADLLVSINQSDDSSSLQLSLGSGSFSDFLDQVQDTKSLQSKVYSLLQSVKASEAAMRASEAALQESLTELSNLQTSLQLTTQSLTSQKQQEEDLLTETRGQESNFKALLTSTDDQEAQIQEKMNELDASAGNTPGLSALAPDKGILAWPLQGVITQGYGNTGFTELGYNFHNGIDIAGPAGTPIAAAADGTVLDTGVGQEAYGNWVAIKHTITAANGHQLVTLYGHMTKFIVTVGEAVHAGDIIGYEGNTGNTTRLLYGPEHGFHLHFGVFDAVGFNVENEVDKTYGPYELPYGYTYDPLDFLPGTGDN